MLQKTKKLVLLIFLGLNLFSLTVLADETLYLEIVINGRNTSHVAEVVQKDNDWQIASSDLVEFGLKLDAPVKEHILLSEIKNTTVFYDSNLQRLLITVPSNILPMQHFGANIPDATKSIPRRDTGVFINYNLVASSGNMNSQLSSLWHELHFFNKKFFFVSNGMAQDNSDGFSNAGYTRFETYYQHDNENNLQLVTVGDVINATPTWGRSIRLGGIRIARDYELNPALINYPLPEFYGESALPGSAELIINNQLRWREQITSGPFLVNTVPYISGAGGAQIVTTNPQGQQIQQSVNFYVTNQLLAPSMFDYDVTMGFRREDFGLRSNAYADRPAISSSVRYGLNKYVTPQILFQAGEGLQLGGVGATFLAGSLGVVDLATSVSNYHNPTGINEHGNQASISYNYIVQKFGINANYLRRYGDYRDLGTQDNPALDSALRNTQMQISLSYQDNKIGGFNLGYFRATDNKNEERSLANLSWTRYFKNDLTAFLSFSRTLSATRENTLSLTLSLPFGESSQVSTTSQRNSNGKLSNQIQAMSNAPYEGGFGWGASVDDSVEKNRYLVGNWRTRYSQISLSSYQSTSREEYTGTLNGALVLMDNQIYATHFITDSFAIVDAEHPDVPVLIGHQLVGTSDRHGKLLVPDLTSYLENHLSIDPMLLPVNAVVSSMEQLVSPRRKGGIHVKFPIRFSQSALVTVVTPDNQPLPAGALLIQRDAEQTYTAGWGGEVYFENLEAPISLYWDEGECFVDVKPAIDKAMALPRLGPFVCQPPVGDR